MLLTNIVKKNSRNMKKTSSIVFKMYILSVQSYIHNKLGNISKLFIAMTLFIIYTNRTFGQINGCFNPAQSNYSLPEAKYMTEFNKAWVEFASKSNYVTKDKQTLYTVPVIFHVIHWNSTSGTGESYGMNENIKDNKLDSIIIVLNEDFRKKAGTHGGSNNTAADCMIEFCRVKQDTSGNSHSGVNRAASSVSVDFKPWDSGHLTQLHSASSSNNWPKALNIYIVQSIWGWTAGWSYIGGNELYVEYAYLTGAANTVQLHIIAY